jgi:hypothetical protein
MHNEAYAVQAVLRDSQMELLVEVLVDGDTDATVQLGGRGRSWEEAVDHLHQANITWFQLEQPFSRLEQVIELCRQAGGVVAM